VISSFAVCTVLSHCTEVMFTECSYFVVGAVCGGLRVVTRRLRASWRSFVLKWRVAFADCAAATVWMTRDLDVT